MRIGRTLPPVAAPLTLKEILSGVSGSLSGEKTVARFEAELRDYYRVPHAFLLCSGKAALTVILLALKELAPDKDEVLIPAYTCYSVPAAIIKAGLKVRICDIEPETLDFDWSRMEEAMESDRLLCVISTHLFGLPADVERLRQVVSRRGLYIVEDAAQAMGGETRGGKVGTLGDVALFSLGRGKALSTVSGGIIITASSVLGEAITKVVNTLPREGAADAAKTFCYACALFLLMRPGLYWLPKALPFLKLGETTFDPSFELKRLGGFQSGLAAGWQKKLVLLRDARLKRAAALTAAGIAAPASLDNNVPNLIKFPVLVEDSRERERLLEQSEKKGLGIAAVYPDSIAGIAELKGILTGGKCPKAESVARSIVSLPVHPLVNERDVKKLAKLVR